MRFDYISLLIWVTWGVGIVWLVWTKIASDLPEDFLSRVTASNRKKESDGRLRDNG